MLPQSFHTEDVVETEVMNTVSTQLGNVTGPKDKGIGVKKSGLGANFC